MPLCKENGKLFRLRSTGKLFRLRSTESIFKRTWMCAIGHSEKTADLIVPLTRIVCCLISPQILRYWIQIEEQHY